MFQLINGKERYLLKREMMSCIDITYSVVSVKEKNSCNTTVKEVCRVTEAE